MLELVIMSSLSLLKTGLESRVIRWRVKVGTAEASGRSVSDSRRRICGRSPRNCWRDQLTGHWRITCQKFVLLREAHWWQE